MTGMVDPQALQTSGWKQRELPGFAGVMGPLWTKKVDDEWRYGILAEARHLNSAGLVHGGLLMALLDHALSAIAWEHSGRKTCVTVQMDCLFISAVRAGAFIEARGRVLRASGSLAFVQGGVYVDDALVFSGSSVQKVLKPGA